MRKSVWLLLAPLMMGAWTLLAEEPAEKATGNKPSEVEEQKGGTAEQKSQPSLKFKGPDIEFKGGNLEVNVPEPGWKPKEYKLEDFGLWLGPEVSLFVPDLNDRLHPLTEMLGLNDFSNALAMFGMSGKANFGSNFGIEAFFRYGYSQMEDQVDDTKRTAATRLSMFGAGGQFQPALISKSSWLAFTDKIKWADQPLLPPDPPYFILGSRFGAGNLFLYGHGEGFFDQWTGNEWMLFLEPYAGVGFSLHKWVRAELTAGYSFLQFFTGTSDLVWDDKSMIDGDNFSGLNLNFAVRFGTDFKK